jgi:heme-degrading monooxygenase HmoA
MHARVTITQTSAADSKEAIAISRDQILPIARTQKGFKGYLLLSNPKTGKGITVTLWETEADMIANEKSKYYDGVLGKVRQLFAGAPVTEHYEVAVQV